MRRSSLSFLFLILIVLGCEPNETTSSKPIPQNDWEGRAASSIQIEQLNLKSTYLSVYSQIYDRSHNLIYDLTATVSLRNISDQDTVYILRADYYDTHGTMVKAYLKNPIFILPLETLEIVIEEQDKTGGTGANFIFDWCVKPDGLEPLFEAVMLSSRQEGVSFTTQGVNRN